MVRTVSRKVTDRLLYKEIIRDEDYEIYQYGLEQLLTSILDLMTLFVIGFLMGMIWQGITFVSSFMLLRKYAGGYHASTPLRCYLLTNFVILGVLSVMKYIEIDNFICLGLLVTSSVIILFLSPVESENKPLDSIEKMLYRKKTFIVWGIEIFGAIVFIAMKISDVAVCIMMAQATLGSSQVIEKLKTK